MEAKGQSCAWGKKSKDLVSGFSRKLQLEQTRHTAQPWSVDTHKSLSTEHWDTIDSLEYRSPSEFKVLQQQNFTLLECTLLFLTNIFKHSSILTPHPSQLDHLALARGIETTRFGSKETQKNWVCFRIPFIPQNNCSADSQEGQLLWPSRFSSLVAVEGI